MNRIARLLGAAALGLPLAALAGPADYVYTPTVEYGEREIDLKAGTRKFTDDAVRESATSLGLGLGATEWWFTEAYLKYAKATGGRTRYDAFEWENKFQLTEPNQYFVTVGLITEVEIPRERKEEGYEFKIGPLFEGDAGPVRWNANLLFERSFRGSHEEPHKTGMGYQLQARLPVRQGLEAGLQAFGEMGEWNHWEAGSHQHHVLGPAVFGKVKLGGREAIRYNAAALFGATKVSADNGVRLQVEYEF
jgi:hypothetical protein